MSNTWLVTFLTAIFSQFSPKSSEKILLHIVIMLLIPGGLPPVALFHPGFCGADYPATSPPRPAGVWPASGARSTATHAWPCQPIPIPQHHFSHLHVDLVGPLQYSNNFNYIFTNIDRTTKWMEAVPSFWYVRGSMRKGLNFFLDFTFWCTQNDHFRSWAEIYF